MNDTIFALSSAPGRAGVSVLRVSGPRAGDVISNLASRPLEPRKAVLCLLRDPTNQEPIDRVLMLWFPAPHSFTGEDIVEIHAHGSQAVVERLLSLLGGFEDFRLAEPGEYARRAFENGKMDLTAVEGLADLVNAQTEGQRRQALRQSEGHLGKIYEDWRHQVLSASALLEAGIDFSDESDIGDDLAEQAMRIVEQLHQSVSDHLRISGQRGEQMRDGFRLVIAGAPNVGKSSLLNTLARRDAAIVTEVPGTTTDIIEVHLTLAGFPVLVTDTAGIRKTSGVVEREGIRRTMQHLDKADLVLYLQDPENRREDRNILVEFQEQKNDIPVWRILSKADLCPEKVKKCPDGFDLVLSTLTGEGIEELVAELETFLKGDALFRDEPVITRERHRQEVLAVKSALEHFLNGSLSEIELRSEDLRLASAALGRLTGRIDVEELLGQIFAEFCIGK